MPREVVCTDTGSEEVFLDLFHKEGSGEWPIGARKEWFCGLFRLLLNKVSEGLDRA